MNTPHSTTLLPTAKAEMRPGPWQARLTISVPAMLLLLVLGMGLANYLIISDTIDRINALESSVDRMTPEGVHAQTRRIIAEQLQDLIVVLFVFCGLALAGGIGLVVAILRPLRKLTAAAQSIAQGSLPRDIELRAGFEIGQLGKSFNTMIEFVNTMIAQREAYLTEQTENGTMTVDLDGRISSLNPVAARLLGVDDTAVVGETIEKAAERHDGYAEPFLRFALRCNRAMQSARPENCARSLNHICGDSAVEISLDENDDGPEAVSVACSVLYDENRDPTGALFSLRDTRHLRHLNELFNRTDQLAALGTFTIGLSHELRNPLGALKGTAQLLQEKVADNQEARPYLNRIITEVDRLDLLVRELYDYSSAPLEVSPRPVDLNALTHRALQVACQGRDDKKTEAVRISEQYTQGLPWILVQEDRMLRAVSHVMVNALEHMLDDATLTLRTGPVGPEPDAALFLEIHNTGSHIAPENLGKIFEPFFSTRARGTGLGLAITYQIATQNRCRLSVDNIENGVLFRFVFPRLAEET